MNIYFAGGEDIDFLQSGNAPTVTTTAGYFRSGYARCAVGLTNGQGLLRSAPFAAGTQTNCWLTFRYYVTHTSGTPSGIVMCGLVNSANGNSGYGLWIGFQNNGEATTLYANSSSGLTQLAVEPGSTFGYNTLTKIDLQVSSWGTSATVNVYSNGSLVITWTGNLSTVSGGTGISNVDSVCVNIPASISGVYVSEVVVADSDTRGLIGLQTLALTGAGTTHAWTNNTYTNINGTSYSDASPAYTNSTAQDQEYTVTAPTPTVFSVIGVVQNARAAIPAGSTPTHLKLGYGSSGTGYFGTGAQKSPTVGFAEYQQIDPTNPITSAAWAQSDLTGLQLDMQSA